MILKKTLFHIWPLIIDHYGNRVSLSTSSFTEGFDWATEKFDSIFQEMEKEKPNKRILPPKPTLD